MLEVGFIILDVANITHLSFLDELRVRRCMLWQAMYGDAQVILTFKVLQDPSYRTKHNRRKAVMMNHN